MSGESPDRPVTQPAAVVRAAAVQMDVRIGENEANLARVLERLEEAARNGGKLVVFPECALSGYCFDSFDEAWPYAIEAAWGPLADFGRSCRRLGLSGVLGFLEKESKSRRLYNSALVANLSDNSNASVRKTHLPTLGVDRFVQRGESLHVFGSELGYGRIGTLICYDIRFPEAARVLGLKGADIIALPTNWPEGAESSPDFITRARAWENRVFIVAANRVGVERDRRFIGRSQIVSPAGDILAEAGPEEETILYADLDLALARQKRIVYEPGAWEIDITGDRRPELYAELTRDTHARTP